MYSATERIKLCQGQAKKSSIEQMLGIIGRDSGAPA